MAKKKTAPEFYIVEEGIPMPNAESRFNTEIPTKVYPFQEMRVGDSFLCPAIKRPSAISYAAKAFGKRRGMIFTVKFRVMEDGNLRVWRVQ